MEYFQDDVYPETRVTWEEALTSQEWLAGEDGLQPSISLRPHDMKLCEELSVCATDITAQLARCVMNNA